ncbi:MAG: hypothetical protein JWN04_936 [Myxococcaceae bacterium]|nr:hypothetical protein [Myxococcaceae bacterium]
MLPSLVDTTPPAIETGAHSFVRGWWLSTRAALLTPSRFYGQLATGPLGIPFVFAAVSLALPLIAADLVGYTASEHGRSSFDLVGLVRSSISPLVAAALLVAVEGVLWNAVSRALGARLPLNLALRAMAYLTSIGTTFGVVMTLSGFAPESAFCVILWYLSLLSAYTFASYALYRLARGPYSFGPLKAGFMVWLFQIACTTAIVAGVALYTSLGGNTKPAETIEEPPAMDSADQT